MTGTLIATFDEYGEVLSWVITPEVDLAEIIHSNIETDAIRTYAIGVEWTGKLDEALDDGLDMLAQVHAIDAKKRSRRA